MQTAQRVPAVYRAPVTEAGMGFIFLAAAQVTYSEHWNNTSEVIYTASDRVRIRIQSLKRDNLTPHPHPFPL